MKTLVIAILAATMLGLTACDDGGGKSGGSNNYNRYQYRGYSDDVYVTSPRGSNCIYDNDRYYESYRSGYNSRSTYRYRDNFSPYNLRYGNEYNAHYRDPRYTNNGCDDINLLLGTPGYYPYTGDYRILGLGNCGFNRQPIGIGWGVVCVDISIYGRFGSNRSFRGGVPGVGSSRGQVCNPHTDTFCSCRPITYGGNRNPGQYGICQN